jgi:D-amino-acid oxidase
MSSVRSKRSILWRDISPEPLPLVRLGPESPRILIVGGVTGLVTARTLLGHGYKVTVLAKEWPT